MSDRVCATCKYDTCTSGYLPCKNCIPFGDERPYWEPTMLEVTEVTPVTDDKNISMIKSIIDEAMEKRDRTVTVYISGENMHVSVTAVGEDDPRWIPMDGGFACSVCGQWDLRCGRYCRFCGEALKVVSEEVKSDENQ